MDKFGVFKLLSSLFEGNKSVDPVENFNFGQEKPAEQKPASTINTPHPLQSGMINTMTSHDSFVKRVKDKNKK